MRLPEGLKTALEIASEHEVRALEQAWTSGMLPGIVRKYMPDAPVASWRRFLSDLARVDFAILESHREALANPGGRMLHLSQIRPVRFSECRMLSSGDQVRGIEALAARRVAAVVFAGGTATRFQTEKEDVGRAFPVPPEMLRIRPPSGGSPKAVYPVTPVLGKSFAWRLAEEALACGLAHGRMPVLLFMVSDNTAEPLDRHLDLVCRASGIPRTAVSAGPRQRMLPRIDKDGDLLVNGLDGSLYWTGDGHGGVFDAIHSPQEGVLASAPGATLADRLRNLGVRHLVMGNVDNAMLRPFEPCRIGAHISAGAGFTVTLVKRSSASEKVGVPVLMMDGGRFAIVEYSELSPELGEAAGEDGGLLLDCAHVNTNIVSLEAADASFPHTLYTGKLVDTPAGRIESSSFEKLSQNIASSIDPARVLALAVERPGYFLPTKNVTGPDSLETTVHSLIEGAGALLSACGATVAGAGQGTVPAVAEISPLLGTSAAELERLGIGRGWTMEPGSSLYLGAMKAGGDGLPYSEGLHLEQGASLLVTSDAPLGTVTLDQSSGRIEVDGSTAGRISIGAGVRISQGVSVRIHLRPGESYSVEPGSVVDHDVRNI